MKTRIINLFLLPALIAGLGLMPAGLVTAQTFTTLHSFTGSDGANPYAGLILSGNTLYGTAYRGGGLGNGTVFRVNTDGTDFTNLYSFTGGSDGANPQAGLILSGNTLYGTTRSGGSGRGIVFAVNTDGTGFTNLHTFTALNNSTNSDGANPYAGLVLSGNTLYGVASGLARFAGAPPPSAGTVFALNMDGTGFTNLYRFTNPSISSNGGSPYAGLILSGDTLYGTASEGGSGGVGVVFAVNTNSTGFSILYNFTGSSDGAMPYGAMILSGNTVYGTTVYGGSSDNGTVFSLSFAPRLTLIPSGHNVILTWPTNYAGFDYTGYTLQSTTNLVSPVVWTSVVPGPVVVNGQNTVNNPISVAQQFYRLSQ